jgi:2-oxoglutarate ferredoxin oxidoreductase subunit beta
MSSLLNKNRPPVFCPGCAHETVTRALDMAFSSMRLQDRDIVIVSDIGCSGLFDTFFNTHAFHGLHGRALTYATGIKLACPDLTVIVTMGDGGLGIGGAHLLSTCRRNIDLTLLVLNNFNYGMTGGQFSSTTPPDASVGSGFLNQLEKPIDVAQVAAAAGAGHVSRASVYGKDLAQVIEKAIQFKGFSILDLWGVCPGRYTKKNKLTPKSIEQAMAVLPAFAGPVEANYRDEYGEKYRALATEAAPHQQPVKIEKRFAPPVPKRSGVIFLGGAGQRIVTGGEILCYAGLTAGLNTAQKNDYPITVLRGHSVSEVVLSPDAIGYTGIDIPDVVLVLGPEGVTRRKELFAALTKDTMVIRASDVSIPACAGKTITVDFHSLKIKAADRTLAALAMLARLGTILSIEMLKEALRIRFKGDVLEKALALVDKTISADII